MRIAKENTAKNIEPVIDPVKQNSAKSRKIIKSTVFREVIFISSHSPF